MNKKTEHILVYTCITFACLAYMPQILQTSLYSLFVAISGLCIATSLVINIKKRIITDKILQLTLLIGFLVSIIYTIYGEYTFSLFSNLLLTLSIYLFGYTLNDHSEEFLNKIIKLFCILAVFLGIYSISKNIGGFEIAEGGYAIMLKNSSGVILGIGTILTIYILQQEKTTARKVFWIIVAILTFFSLLTFRNRSTSVAVIFLLIILLVKFTKIKKLKFKHLGTIIIVIAIIFIIGINPIDYIIQSFTENTDTSSIESLSSGRTYYYSMAIDIYLNDIIGGNLSQNIKLLTIDNFVLNICARTGLWGMLIYFPIYFYLWIRSIKGIIKGKDINAVIPDMCIFVLLIVSLFEATYPFGPGTAILMAYFLLGYHDYIQDSSQCKQYSPKIR